MSWRLRTGRLLVHLGRGLYHDTVYTNASIGDRIYRNTVLFTETSYVNGCWVCCSEFNVYSGKSCTEVYHLGRVYIDIIPYYRKLFLIYTSLPLFCLVNVCNPCKVFQRYRVGTLFFFKLSCHSILANIEYKPK